MSTSQEIEILHRDAEFLQDDRVRLMWWVNESLKSSRASDRAAARGVLKFMLAINSADKPSSQRVRWIAQKLRGCGTPKIVYEWSDLTDGPRYVLAIRPASMTALIMLTAYNLRLSYGPADFRKCLQCGGLFLRKRDQKFCSVPCKRKHYRSTPEFKREHANYTRWYRAFNLDRTKLTWRQWRKKSALEERK